MYNAKTRNILGVIGWFAVSLVINLLALIPMYLREKYQSQKGDFDLEWNDIILYGFAIVTGSGVQGLAMQGLGWVE